jgi:protein-disulfide isomerase
MKAILYCVTSALLLLAGCASPSSQSDELKQTIRAVLRENPSLVLESLRGQEAVLLGMLNQGVQQLEESSKRDRRLAEMERPFQPAIDLGRPIRGNPSAPITIVEYADFECPFCAEAHQTIVQVLNRYPGEVRFLYKHNPIDQIHPMADSAARWFEAIASQDQEKAWAFHDRLYESPNMLQEGDAGLESIAGSLGLDAQVLRKELFSKTISSQIERDKQEALSFGFPGTPAFLINGVSLRGAYPLDEFVQVIELLKSKQGLRG